MAGEIVIRGQEPEDSDAIGRLLIQPGVFPTTLQLPYTPLASRREAAPVPGLYRLVADLDGTVVGSVSLLVNQRARRHHAADLGIAVDERYHGRGVGTALLEAVLALADDWLNLHRVELTVATANAHAVRLYRRYGFEIEGTLRDYAFTDGAYADVFAMGRIRPDRAGGRELDPGIDDAPFAP
jgi:L-phenylalanine/L-methionine N-acetyltransferase